jgi:transcription elongation GreA/GreB family factor
MFRSGNYVEGNLDVSRAFMKEMDGAAGEDLAELQVSAHRNLVTPCGLKQIEQTVEALRASLTEARSADDRATVARIQRDLRYWVTRLSTAEVVTAPVATSAVRFGATVTIEFADGTRAAYQVVGEDEADPASGKISYVSPIARSLIGKSAGAIVSLTQGEATIVEIT